MPTSGSDRVQELLEQGNDQILQERYQEGAETFREVISLEQQNLDAWCNLGFCYYLSDQDQDAIEAFTQALQIQPNFILALARRGLAYLSSQPDLASLDLEKATLIEPETAEDWYGRSLGLWGLKRELETLEALDEAIQLNPENPYFWRLQGSTLLALNLDREAIAAYDKALEIYPRYSRCWYHRGVALATIKNYENSIISFDKALEIQPYRSLSWSWRGYALKELNQYEDAIASFDRAIEIDPDDHYSLVNRAACLRDLSRYEEAISGYDRALEMDSNDQDAWLNRAYALQNLSRYEEAIASFDKVLEISSDHCYAWLNRGHCLRSLNQYESALNSYDAAIKIESSNYFAWAGRGDTLFNSRQYEEAIANYDKALEIQSDYYAAWLWRGHAFSNLNEFNQAIDSYNRAIEINPNDYYSLVNRANCLQNLACYEEAVSAFNEVLKIKPDDASSWGNLGRCLYQLKRMDEALNSFEASLSLNSQDYSIWQIKVNLLRVLGRFDQEFSKFMEEECNPNCIEGWYVYADTLCFLKRHEEALNIIDKLLEAKPDYALAWSLKSFVLILLKRYEEACINSDHALELESQNFLIWAERASVMNDAGNYNEALRSYEKALEFESARPIISLRSVIYTEADIWVGHGDALMRQGQFERAINSYRKALEIDPKTLRVEPDYSKIWNSYAEACMKLGHYEDAFAAYDQSLELNANQLNIWLDRGEAAIFIKRDEEALKSFDFILSIEPENLKALNGRANSLKGLERHEEALEVINRLLILNISSADTFGALSTKANILAELDCHREALSIYHQMLESEFGVKFAWFIWALIAMALTKLSTELDEIELCEQVIDACNKTLDLLPKQSKLDTSPFDNLFIDYYGRRIASTELDFYTSFQALIWTERGLSLKTLESFEKALESFEAALSFDAENSLIWCEKGNALFHLKRYQQTIDAHDIYLKLAGDKSNWTVLLQRGIALSELKQYEKAVSSYQQAIQIKPDNHLLWHRLGDALHSVGQFEEALKAYQESLKFDAQCKIAWSQQGEILADLCRYQESLESYDRAIALDPANAAFYNGRGWALNSLGFYSDALVAYDQALQNDEQFWLAWRNRGWTTYLLKSLEEALDVWDEGLLKLRPNHPNYSGACAEIHYFKGFAHYEKGRKQADYFSNWRKARNYYLTALKLLNSTENRERYLDLLKDLIRVLSGLGQNEEADELGRQGSALLQRLLSETSDPLKQQHLALKYACFEQLTVDSYIRSDQLVKALETAETGKNTCLSWLFPAYRSEAKAPEKQLWQSLDASTAIIYWHLSPASLTTFILTSDTEVPATLLDDHERVAQEEELALSNRQLLEFESWMNNWNWLYTDYGNAQDKTARENHLWRTQMSDKLEQLKQILKIPTIVHQLHSSIRQLILIPHRDLHRFPLHILFPDHFTITYLPSAQMGLTLQERKSSKADVFEHLLSIESPNSTGEKHQKKFERLGFAALESRLIAQLFQTTTIQPHEATQQKTWASIRQPHNGLHFAGHAFYNFNDPKNSALALTGEDRLSVVDICQSDPLVQGYSLVCLSACETALTGNQTITAEYVGLVSGFLRGGARQVVSTLWTVQSVSSSLLMIQFYSLLKQGKPAALALKEAQHWLRDAKCQDLINFLNDLLENHLALNRSTRKFLQTEVNRFRKMPQDSRPFHNPYHWAGFTLTGLPPTL